MKYLKENKIYLVTGLVALVLITSAYIFSHRHATESDEEPVQIVGPNLLKISQDAMSNLKVTQAQLTDFPDVLSVTGKISPTEDRTHVVPARTAGRIEKVLIASGESVVAGQPLAMIWSPDYVASREEYIQSIRKDKSMTQSENDFSGLAKLARKKLESMGLSKADLDELEQAANDPSEKSDETEKYLMVRAPRSGAIIAKSALLGNTVNLGDALFMIADLHEVWFLGDMYPEDLSKVKKDQKVIIEGAVPGQSLEGKVSFISPIVDATSRTIKIRALMNNPSLAMRGDMYVQGNLVLSNRKAIVIPTQAVLRDQDDHYVFKILTAKIVDGHSTGLETQKTKVTIVGEKDGWVAIGEGLSPGDQIVTDGAILLNAVLSNNEK
jgi:Cu(I)/Ag(I) efflux system membrane fusion protein